jgi:hypothetical protein
LDGGIGGCDISGALSFCKWKPKNCDKPDAPAIFATDVVTYNLAVDEYNRYLQEIDEYKECIIAEGKADITHGFPDLVVDGAKEAESEVDEEANRAKRSLELARSLVR